MNARAVVKRACRSIVVLMWALIYIYTDVSTACGDSNLSRVELHIGINNVHLSGPESDDVIIVFDPEYGSVYSPIVIVPLTKSRRDGSDKLIPVTFNNIMPHNDFEKIGNVVTKIVGINCFVQGAAFYIDNARDGYRVYYVRAIREAPFSGFGFSLKAKISIEKFILRENINLEAGQKMGGEYTFERIGRPFVLKKSSVCLLEELESMERTYLGRRE